MISSRLARRVEKPLLPVMRRIKVSPNALTLAGFLITTAGACVLAYDLRAGGLVILLGSLFDSFDGMVARANGKESAFGAYLDSVLDRYSDAFIFLGLAYHLRADAVAAALCLGALVGASLVSYTRARAEGLGAECKVGIMERPERIILVTAGSIFGFIVPALWALFVFTHFTALQRMVHTRNALAVGKGKGKKNAVRPTIISLKHMAGHGKGKRKAGRYGEPEEP